MEIAKRSKLENLGIGLLRRSVGNPRRGVALHSSVGCPRLGEAEVPKCHPSGMLRCSFATSQQSYVVASTLFTVNKFSDFCFRKSSIRTPIV